MLTIWTSLKNCHLVKNSFAIATIWVNLLGNHKILDQIELKAAADDILNDTDTIIFAFVGVENMAKWIG